MAIELDDVKGIEGILDINERKRIEQENLNNARQQAQDDFDFYARDLAGDPLNLDKVEEYRSQEDHFNARTPEQANANSRFTPILDKYLLDNEDAFRNLDEKQNRDQYIDRTMREEEHYYPMFSGEKREEFPELKDSEYQNLAVASYFAETSESAACLACPLEEDSMGSTVQVPTPAPGPWGGLAARPGYLPGDFFLQ